MAMQELELLRAACCIAGVDGEINEPEKAVLGALAKRVGVGAASLRAMMELATTDAKFRDDQIGLVHSDPRRSFETLYRMARVDPDVGEAQRSLLTRFGRRLGLSVEEMNEVITRAHAR
jgi:hypothetical protein